MFYMNNTTFLYDDNVFCFSLPRFSGLGYDLLNEYFQKLGEKLKDSVEGEKFFGECIQGKRGGRFYLFFDVLTLNEKYLSGILVLLGYEFSELVIFRCYPITLNVLNVQHLSVSRLLDKKQKNIPYCIFDNTVYGVKNLYTGQRMKMRRKNYRMLISFEMVGRVN